MVTGENLFARSPVETIQKAAGRPEYIMHTRADTGIDISQSELLAAAAKAAGVPVTTWFPERASTCRRRRSIRKNSSSGW